MAKPDARRHACAAVTRDKGVVFALFGVGKAREPALLADGRKPFGAPRDEFVRVTLVPHVEEQFVFGKIEDEVQGKRQFYHAEIGREMPAVFAYGGDDLLAAVVGERFQLF